MLTKQRAKQSFYHQTIDGKIDGTRFFHSSNRFPAVGARACTREEHPTQIERQKVDEYFESPTEERARVVNISLSLPIVQVSRRDMER